MMHNHIKNLINLGYLVDESVIASIENLNENDFYRLLEGLKRGNSFLINHDLIKKILIGDLKIIKEFAPVKKFTVQDYVKNLNEKYNALQNILMKRVELSDLISINKINSGDVSVIGLVKDKTEREDNFLINLEDQTGNVQAIIPKIIGEKLSLDDVIAASGKINNKILFVDTLVFPDVLIKPVNYTVESIKVAFLENEKDCDANFIFSSDKVTDKIKGKTYNIRNPCLIEIENIVILVLMGHNPLDALRKRYVSIENSDFIIEPSPDIIFTDKDINTNYKSITIVSLNKIIDLKTREIINS